jgi:uncharacterized membrane protein HdeD (DUF308 family)
LPYQQLWPGATSDDFAPAALPITIPEQHHRAIVAAKAEREIQMLTSLGVNWWIVLVRGIGAILFSVVAFVSPGMTLTALVILYGVYVLVDGWLGLALGLADAFDGAPWWPMILGGMASTMAGALTLLWPGITEILLLAVIATWLILRGGAEIAAGIGLRAAGLDEWRLLLSGICSIAFGVTLFTCPRAGALAWIEIIASSSAAFGLLTTILALKLRSLHSEDPHDVPGTKPSSDVMSELVIIKSITS